MRDEHARPPAGLGDRSVGGAPATKPTTLRITSFFQGAMIGLGVFTVVLVTFNYSGQAPALFTPGQFAYLLGLGLAICPLLGGTAVLLLRSHRDSEGSVYRP